LGIAGNISYIKKTIREAAEKSGRDPQSITLIAVTKTVPVEQVAEAIGAGLADLGENRVQEAEAKISAIQNVLSPGTPRPRWHLIGHLQRNKAKTAIKLFELIHSVDSLRLAEELSRRAREARRSVEFLLQVNVSGEASKHGCPFSQAEALARKTAGLESVSLKGLMTLAPFSENPEDSRPVFRQLKELFDRLSGLGLPDVEMNHLSMGMSQDYCVAVEEGATLVRVGQAIFGARHVR